MVSGNQVKNVRLATLRGVLVLNFLIIAVSYVAWTFLAAGMPYHSDPWVRGIAKFPLIALIATGLVGMVGSFLKDFNELIMFTFVTAVFVLLSAPVFAFSGPSPQNEIASSFHKLNFILQIASVFLQLAFLFSRQRIRMASQKIVEHQLT
jgi:hypothetical protein